MTTVRFCLSFLLFMFVVLSFSVGVHAAPSFVQPPTKFFQEASIQRIPNAFSNKRMKGNISFAERLVQPPKKHSQRSLGLGVLVQSTTVAGPDLLTILIPFIIVPSSVLLDVISWFGMGWADQYTLHGWGTFGLIAGIFGFTVGTVSAIMVASLGGDVVSLLVITFFTMALNVPTLIAGIRSRNSAKRYERSLSLRPWLNFSREGTVQGGVAWKGRF